MARTITLGLAAALVFASGVGADGDMTADAEVSKFDKEIAKYDRTGDMTRCISPARIRQSTVIDDNHIIFRLSPKRSYLSTLPRKCSSLGFHRAIKYTVRGGRLCAGDIFRVINGGGFIGAGCSFGEFEEIKKKPKVDAEKAQAGT